MHGRERKRRVGKQLLRMRRWSASRFTSATAASCPFAMTRNNILLLMTVAVLGVVLTGIKIYQTHHAAVSLEPIVLYEPLPHPYCNAVGGGAKAYARDSGTRVRVVVGQESTMANLNQNIESLFTVGHKAFAFIP